MASAGRRIVYVAHQLTTEVGIADALNAVLAVQQHAKDGGVLGTDRAQRTIGPTVAGDPLTDRVEQVVRGTFNEFASLLARSGGTEVGAALALGSLVAFASAELLLGQAPVDADREEVIATWVEMVMGLVEASAESPRG